MLRTDAADALRDRQTEDGYLLPAYGDRSFDQLPATVADCLGVHGVPGDPLPDDVFEGVRTDAPVVLHVLVDGFGFEQWARHRNASLFLDRFTETARVSPLTSVFPSETAAALTSLHTGVVPARHGLLGWTQYLPEHDLVVKSLPFETPDGTPAGEFGAEAADLVADGLTPVYDRLLDAGVDASVLAPAGIPGSAYSRYAFGDAASAGYDGLDGPEGFTARLRETIDRAHANAPAYVWAYLPQVDGAAHEHGTRADAYGSTVGEVFRALGRVVESLDEATARETLLLVSADHGLLDMDPAANVDLLSDGRVERAVARDRRGEPLFSGGPRNCGLFAPDEAAMATLDAALSERTLPRLASAPDPTLDRALFGPDRSATFEARRGDLLVVARETGVWHRRTDVLDYRGLHGGLHPQEMLVPFAAARTDRLQGLGSDLL
ncbi:alkaline phosphatase family protein [Haloglomus litoreum]|uniref:alkaline phosphatase family protein n=1 Tax=Haloglomus litoreum TaxID=3034026 RepID=UPI0023E8BB51|nr:alkaline phosphatase family protein [Haloglomus sp. DT116]